MTGPLYALGRLCARHRLAVVAAWLVLVVVLAAAARSAGPRTNDDLSLPGTDSQRASDVLSERFPAQANGTVPITLRAPAGAKVTDARYADAIGRVAQAYAKDPGVRSAVSPLGEQGAHQVSRDGSIGYVSLILRDAPSRLSEDEAERLVALGAPARAAGLRVAAGGYLGQKVSKPSTHVSEVAGIVAAIVILLLTFGAFVAMSLPIGTAIGGLVCGLSILTLLGRHAIELPTTAPALATMIGLGVGIDYGLFVVSRHLDQLRAGMEVRESIARTTATSGGAVVFAGGTVIIALVALAVARIPLVATLGYTSAIVVLVAVVAAITLLPALLSLAGTRIAALALPGRRRRGAEQGSHRWRAWAAFVVAHPWRMLAAGVAILVVLAIPLRLLHLGQTDVGALPPDTEARQAYDAMSQGFGPGANGPMIVAVSFSRPATASDPRLASLGQAIAGTPGVRSVASPLVNGDGSAAVYTVISANAPSDRATEDLVGALRDQTLPAVTKGQGMRADVGGTTAGYIDLAAKISSRLPRVIAVVLALSFVLLMLAFRSLAVPLKAVIANLLSIGAAFGVVTYAFGHHWSATAVGLDGTVPIVSFVPLMMFAILFGLSMDYEVFLMGHVRERFAAGSSARDAIVEGVDGTARVITSAALIMVCVFCAFVINGDPNIKQFGLGMAAAVAVDATVVRCLLVPAVLSLLGRAAWWMPAALDRRLPHVSIEGEEWFAERDRAAAAAGERLSCRS